MLRVQYPQTSLSQWESSHGQLNNLPPRYNDYTTNFSVFCELVQFINVSNALCGCESLYIYRFDWIWQSTALFFCMTHPYSWFGLLMTHPYRSARPIRTVTSGELSTTRVNLSLLKNFSSMVFEQNNCHMHHYEVTHRYIVFNARLLT